MGLFQKELHSLYFLKILHTTRHYDNVRKFFWFKIWKKKSLNTILWCCAQGRGLLQRWLFFIWKILLSPQKSLWQKSHLVLGDLPDLGLSLQSLASDDRPALGRDLLVPTIYGWWRSLAQLGPQKQQTFFCNLPLISASRQAWIRTTDRFFSFLLGLCCEVDCGTLHRQPWAFPNHVQSTGITSGGLQYSSRMISENKTHVSLLLSVTAKKE